MLLPWIDQTYDSMNPIRVQKFQAAFNKEIVRRLLIKYFMDKGLTESFDVPVYPPALQDITQQIPALDGKIEIVPFAEEIDPRTGYAKLGWNMFVLGNQQIFLGYTEHADMADLGRKLSTGQPITEGISSFQTTAKRVVAFVTRVLGNSQAGRLRSVEPAAQRPWRVTMPNGSATFYRRPGAARPEH